jgi:sec-independent protein translocase protein TatA
MIGPAPHDLSEVYHMLPNLGPQELFFILLIVLVLFGGKNIPNLARSLGSGIREFKRAVGGEDEHKGSSETPKSANP